ncbi:MAG: NADH-quinone oxidoreductase subunit A [Candidatus Bathyarchaeota archaeon]|nr:MAG: NADH-quinone oxidoreductase subunit A [Candidatus Bathyarchaeota archaeon]
MLYIGDHLAFWIFAVVMPGLLALLIVISRIFGAVKPNEKKTTTYECGQDPFGDASDWRLLGIARYFGYAVVFFALDAFGWVVLTAAMSVDLTLGTIAIVSVYILVVLTGVAYFLSELHKVVR